MWHQTWRVLGGYQHAAAVLKLLLQIHLDAWCEEKDIPGLLMEEVCCISSQKHCNEAAAFLESSVKGLDQQPGFPCLAALNLGRRELQGALEWLRFMWTYDALTLQMINMPMVSCRCKGAQVFKPLFRLIPKHPDTFYAGAFFLSSAAVAFVICRFLSFLCAQRRGAAAHPP
ncbi:hypothetical protein WJX74_006581 [Apatococcus lobatus]|uniref:Uncharacterized protein n=1 Tax=Apatococcus lobatus TaxID=904363 RepID=A0AAW1RQ85_9CHLO